MRLRPHAAGPGSRGLDPRLTWAPPELDNPTTVNLSSSTRRAILTPNLDYIIDLGPSPISVSGGIEIIGGRNVVIMGGEINVTADYSSGYPSTANIGFKLQGNTTAGYEPQHIFIEGVKLTCTDPGYLADAMYYQANQETNGLLTIQNCRVSGLTYGWAANADGSQGPHADVLQMVGGPMSLRMDRFTASRFGYQGIFSQRTQSDPSGAVRANHDLRNVNLRPSVGETPTGMTYASAGRYGLYATNTEIAEGLVWCCENVYVEKNPGYWSNAPVYPESAAWVVGGVTYGPPPGGDFVGEHDCGIGYVSPGYRGVS